MYASKANFKSGHRKAPKKKTTKVDSRNGIAAENWKKEEKKSTMLCTFTVK